MKELRLVTDQAIGESGCQTKDGLGFGAYADVLARAVLGTNGSFAIGVFGEWGTGKTSLMRMLQQRLNENENVVTIWFNAWRYEQDENLLVPLLATIIKGLGEHRRESTRFADGIRALTRALRSVAYGISLKSNVKIPGLAEIEASFVAKDMIDRETELNSDPLLERSLYYQAFDRLDALDLDDRLRVVVIVDDLDRCFPDQAIRLLEGIKLVLNQPGFVFTIGVARSVLEGYLEHRYREEYGISDFRGHLYLDKLIQLPFYIPPNAGRLNDLAEAIVLQAFGRPDAALENVLSIVAEALGGNPRAVVRFVNNILVDLSINDELVQISGMGLVPVQFFAMSRCLQTKWPDVFIRLTSNDTLCQKIAEDWSEVNLGRMAGAPGMSGQIATQFSTDSGLRKLLFSDAGRSWLSDSASRNSSVHFLRSQQRISALNAEDKIEKADIYVSHGIDERRVAAEIAMRISSRGFLAMMSAQAPNGEERRFWLAERIDPKGKAVILLGEKGMMPSQVAEVEALVAALGSTRSVLLAVLPDAEIKGIPAVLENLKYTRLKGNSIDANVGDVEEMLMSE